MNSNAQPTGEHEVHREATCDHLPDSENRLLIGYFDSCWSAIRTAKSKWPNLTIDGCAYCCPECNNG